jgi:hypothetical protein
VLLGAHHGVVRCNNLGRVFVGGSTVVTLRNATASTATSSYRAMAVVVVVGCNPTRRVCRCRWSRIVVVRKCPTLPRRASSSRLGILVVFLIVLGHDIVGHELSNQCLGGDILLIRRLVVRTGRGCDSGSHRCGQQHG